MRVIRKAVGEIEFATYNPRQTLEPGDPEWERLKRSLETFGLVEPLIWNERTGRLVGGHQRLRILIDEFGESEVPVTVVDLSEAQERALNVVLNNPKAQSSFDDPKLNALLHELEEMDFDVHLTGFDEDDLERRLGANDPVGAAAPDQSGLLDERFEVVVTCENEMEQTELLQRLSDEGFTCRAMVT